MSEAHLGHEVSDKTREKMKNARLGTHPTKETCEKISKAKKGKGLGRHLSDKTKEKIGNAHKGRANPFKGVTGRYTLEQLQKRSEAHLGVPHPHKGPRKVLYNNTWFRSGWEAKYAEYLDKWSIKWEYEPCIFVLEIGGRKTSYTPDFYLPEFGIYHKVKGWTRPGFDNVRKVQPARDQCEINLTVIDCKLLKMMEII